MNPIFARGLLLELRVAHKLEFQLWFELSFLQGIVPLHGVFNIPLNLIVSFILSYYIIGLYSTLTAFGAVLLFVPLQSYVGKGVQMCR